jgi:hypothetical protein
MQSKFLTLYLFCTVFFSSTLLGSEPRELEWDELMPPGYVESIFNSTINNFSATDSFDFDDDTEEGIAAFEELRAQLSSAPIVPELNDQLIKIAGFIVPLDFDFEAETFSSFLLVPYFGACIHVPPPPSNQVIHIQSAKPLEQELLDYAVWVTGKLTTESVASEEAFAGYSIKNAELEIYEEEEE